MYLCPFHPPKKFLHSTLFQTKLLDFPPVLPHEVICAFVLNCLLIVVRWPHTNLETQSFIKNCFLYPYLLTRLRSIFHCQSSQTIPFTYSLSVTQREPSPVLVGLATRLSVVYGYLEFFPSFSLRQIQVLTQPKIILLQALLAT